jgi:hypothetical protein
MLKKRGEASGAEREYTGKLTLKSLTRFEKTFPKIFDVSRVLRQICLNDEK